MILELGIKSKPMSTRGINIKRAFATLGTHGRIISHGIGHRRYAHIVIGQQENGGRGKMTLHMELIAEFLDELWIMPFLSQQVFSRTGMTFLLVHRDDGIEKDGEIGTMGEIGMEYFNQQGIACFVLKYRRKMPPKAIGHKAPEEHQKAITPIDNHHMAPTVNAAAHGGGHIAVISSIAGVKGLAPAPSYSATKAFQNAYIQALEQLAYSQRLPIRFTDIRPGFVDTALIAGSGFPMKMKPEVVARHIVRSIYSQQKEGNN